MKRILGAILLLILGATSAACTRIEPGEVGVKVNTYGGGVEKDAVGPGNYWAGPGVDYYRYPVSTQTFAWTQSTKAEDGSDLGNQEFSFQDKNGLIVTGDVTVAFRVNPALAPKLYQIYRLDMQGLTSVPIKNKVRSELVRAASTMTVEQIYSSGKQDLINRALVGTKKYFEPMGLIIDQLDWAGPIRIPKNIMERVNARARSEQEAVAARAEADTAVAQGEAAFARAKAQADARIEEARGIAEATKIKNSAIQANPAYTDEWTRKWDGKLPQTIYCSQDKPCLELNGR